MVYKFGDREEKEDVEQRLEILEAKHLKKDYQPDRSPFPPPDQKFANAGEIRLGNVTYGERRLHSFLLKKSRLKEHLLIAGRSGSGKTNLAFILMEGLMNQGIKILALDWKRGYRNLMMLQKDLRVYTIGRNVAPFRFNPLIPPPGCEPKAWIKLIVDVIASAYFGGEGVISLLVNGIDNLFRKAGVFDGNISHWPTIQELLIWLRDTKLKGRAAQWKASAERILQAICYGEFGLVVNTQDNSHIVELLDHNVVLEMDSLSSNSDRSMFSEALTLYLYRYRLAQGEQKKTTNMIVLEEAHNLLLKKSSDSKETELENSIRMIREYGLGYVFIDQMPHKLSTVAFANTYATIALSQKLRGDVQAISGAMNLKDEQKEALNTLPIGTAVIRLSDNFTEPFLVKVPLSSVKEGIISDDQVRQQWESCHSNSMSNNYVNGNPTEITEVPSKDNKKENNTNQTKITSYSHPPSPKEQSLENNGSPVNIPPRLDLTVEVKQFLKDIIARPLSTTVSRYKRLHLGQRKGNAVRQYLVNNDIIERVAIPIRTSQVVLYQLTDTGRIVCADLGFAPGPAPQESLEHRYWVNKASEYYDSQGYEISLEYAIKGIGEMDLLAEKPGQKIVVEVETGKSNIKNNLENAIKAGFDKVVFIATNPSASAACDRIIKDIKAENSVELLTWLDLS